MKIPTLATYAIPSNCDVIRFNSGCGNVSGYALKKDGVGESHYTVTSVEIAPPSSNSMMTEITEGSCSFDIIGIVSFTFDDGVAVVSVHGFDFWVAPSESNIELVTGLRVALKIEKFELYI